MEKVFYRYVIAEPIEIIIIDSFGWLLYVKGNLKTKQ